MKQIRPSLEWWSSLNLWHFICSRNSVEQHRARYCGKTITKVPRLYIRIISKSWDAHIINHSHHIEDIARSVWIKSDVKTNGRYEMQSRTNVHFLVFHLTLADAIVCFITMPMETIWRIVIEVFALQSKRKLNEKKHPSKTSLFIK